MLPKGTEDRVFGSTTDNSRSISGGDGVLNIFQFSDASTKSYKIPKGSIVKVVPLGDTVALSMAEENGLVTLLTLDTRSGKSKIYAKGKEIKYLRRLDETPALRGRNIATATNFDPTINSFVYHGGTRKLHVVPLDGSEAKEWLLPAEVVEATLLSQGRVYVTLKGQSPILLNLKNGEKIVLKKLKLEEASRLAHVDAEKAYFTSGDREKAFLISVDLKTGLQKKINLPGLDRENIQFTPKGILYGKKVADYEISLQLMDYKTGEIRDLGAQTKTFYFRNISVSKDGNKLAWFSDGNEAENIAYFSSMDLHSGVKVKLDLPKGHGSMNSLLSDDGNRLAAVIFGAGDASYVRNWDLVSGKVSDFPISDSAEVAGMKFVADNQAIVLQRLTQSSVVIELKNWENFLATAAPAGKAIKADLSSLAKSGKLRLSRDFPEILSFFRKGDYKKEPELAQLYLLQILEESPNTYDGILADFPDLLKIAQENPLDIKKLSPALRKRRIQLATDFLEQKISMLSSSEPKSDMSFWENLIPLRPFLKELPADVKTEAIAKISNTLATKATLSEPLNGIFQPKLFKFIKQEVRSWFGETPKKFTDFVLVREENQLVPVIIGTAPIDGDIAATTTKFGIYAKKLDPIAIPAEGAEGAVFSNQTINWKQEGKEFSAKFEVKTGKPLATLLPNEPTPDYPGLWKDNKLSGLMVTGENLQSANPDLINEYRAYYRANGFRFSAPQPVEDMRAWIAEEISTGRLDYMIKEAHTDGMENDLFRLYTKGSIEKGVKRLENGKEEVIFIYHPKEDEKATALIPNKEFGDWIRAREQGEQGPLVYFNTSCFGASKACHEYQAAASKKLLVLATTQGADTFTNAQDSALQQLLTGFRQQKSYEEIRKMMAKDPLYKSGEGNVYLLPDDPGFDEEIRQKLLRSIDTKLEVIGPNGKPYHLDEVQ